MERYHRDKVLPELEKKKFLVPADVTISQFLVIIRNRIKLNPTQVSTLGVPMNIDVETQAQILKQYKFWDWT